MECANHQSNTVGLCVISEETSKMLMVHRILQDDTYNRQGGHAFELTRHNSSNCTNNSRVFGLAVPLAQSTCRPPVFVLADETIITWTDPDIGTDVALSFQEAQGCSAIW
jgi:protein phosphatase-4 regulatory subunit 3